MSVGTPNAGGLVNGVQAVASPLYTLVSPGDAWGTQETLNYLNTAVQAVQDEFPDTPPLALGDIGARHGGPLRPHISHQAGRDLDISFYYRDGTHWYARGTRDNLDFPRLWAFVRALIAKTDIDLILLDHGLQEPLKEYALSIGEDPIWLDQIFQGKAATRAIIRHAPGHATHLHLRFFNPISSGDRAPLLPGARTSQASQSARAIPDPQDQEERNLGHDRQEVRQQRARHSRGQRSALHPHSRPSRVSHSGQRRRATHPAHRARAHPGASSAARAA